MENFNFGQCHFRFAFQQHFKNLVIQVLRSNALVLKTTKRVDAIIFLKRKSATETTEYEI